ncbi:MAG TPA: 16S rRNA (cytosine(967)-C(5))-methyltransferase RsmB [Nitrospira sp.]|nr:16S rRNA (cytosine(967)-C(5))-methyltransferase RsmB [Nitrospira sp.]
MPSTLQPSDGPSQPYSARSIALSVLVESAQSDEGLDVLLDRALTRTPLDNRDRALSVELTYGVLRRLGTVDWRLEPILDKPLSRLPVAVQMLLRLGAYQLLFLDRIPQSAAVNESVKLAKAQSQRLKRDWSGLVNAVLRTLVREPSRPWPSTNVDAAQALSVRHSVPEWLSRRWVERLGITGAEAACEQTSLVPPVTLRVNRLQITRNEFLTRLQEAGIGARPTSVSPVGITLEDGGPIPSLPGFAEGQFYVEDEAAQLIPPLLEPHPRDVVLDACAAPGGKATHLAELMQDQGAIYAVDRKGARQDVLRSNCYRLKIQSVVPVVSDIRDRSAWRKAMKPAGKGTDQTMQFDRILVDAPCSGLGVLRRHPEAKWRKDSEAFERHHTVQFQILESVAPCLRPGGVLVYSTCSTEPEENESVIDQFLRAHAGFRRESVAPWLPEAGQRFLTERGDLSTMGNCLSMDGFYAARLKRVET